MFDFEECLILRNVRFLRMVEFNGVFDFTECLILRNVRLSRICDCFSVLFRDFLNISIGIKKLKGLLKGLFYFILWIIFVGFMDFGPF